MLPLRLSIIVASLSPQQSGDSVLVAAVQEHGLPSQCGGGNSCAGDGVPHIMMTISEGPFPVFPRLAPVHGSQTEHKCVSGERTEQPCQCFRQKLRPPFEPVFLRR